MIQQIPSTVEGVSIFQAVDRQGNEILGPSVCIVGIMHGNEPVGRGVVEALHKAVKARLVRGKLTTILANLWAEKDGLRHTASGEDMNRLWSSKTLEELNTRPLRSYEEERVVQLAPILLESEAVFDLHSTSRPSDPFLLFRDDQRHAIMARKLGVEHLVTGMHENGILSGGLCSNVGLKPAQTSKRLGFTFEAGEHTAPGNVARAFSVVERFLQLLDVFSGDVEPLKMTPMVFEVLSRVKQAPSGTEQLRFVGFEGGEPGGGRRGPLRQLHSFERVQAGEVVLRRGAQGVIRATSPFAMLMPAPTTAPDTDLYYVAQRRHGGLSLANPRTDEQARTEASAIERMLDLIAQDRAAEGTTYVGFDSKLMFDACADWIARTSRLPKGHIDRRVTIVGRGDVGASEEERRAGARYRQAMRDAFAADVEIERIQLMRGATIAWLSTLIGKSVRSAGDNAVLRMSFRHPSTTSLLICGDAEHALKTGDTRNVAVVVLVEAPQVEVGSESEPRVSVLRAGLVSSRFEVLRTATSLVDELRKEHRDLVRHGLFRDEEVVQRHVREDGAIRSLSNFTELAALRRLILSTQLRQWVDQLHGELFASTHFDERSTLHHELAHLVGTTGILDIEALKQLVVHEEGEGYRVDCSSLPQLLSVLNKGELPEWVRLMARGRGAVEQPLHGNRIHADNLERWVGWKRSVGNLRLVPYRFGKDVELAWSGDRIRTHLAGVFRQVVSKAEHSPGEWLVVVAGDGLNPARDRLEQASDLLRAYRALICDSNVRHMRIQHARGTHLSWMKDFLENLDSRAPGGEVSLQWENDVGATVNVVMVAQRAKDEEAPGGLSGWRMMACAVVLSDLAARGKDGYKVGMFTDQIEGGPVSHELMAFGRAHCESLLQQTAWQLQRYDRVRVEEHLVNQIAKWIERVRLWGDEGVLVPRDRDARGRWVASRLGLRDARLARALGTEMERRTSPHQAALALWESVPPWPGPALMN